MFGMIVTSVAKVNLVKNMSRYQIGTKPGHRSQEHLFTIRSLISLYNGLKESLIVTLYDLKKFFDRECLIDVMDALYNCDVKGKIYRLLYMMNKDSIIQVKTGVGLSEKEESGANVSQGTIEGAIVSAANANQGITLAFNDQ